MKRIISLATGLVMLAASTGALAAAFQPGSIVVYRINFSNNSTTITNRGNVVFLDEYPTNFAANATPIQSIMIRTNYFGANAPMLADGTAASEGGLTRSVDGRFVVLGGYGALLGQFTNFALPSTFNTEAGRVVGLIDGSGRLDSTTVMTNSTVDQENPRCAASTEGTNIWYSGSDSGLRYVFRGNSDPTQLSTFVTTTRMLNIISSNLYFSTASGSTIRIGEVTNGTPNTIPTSGVNVGYTNLPGMITNSGSPYAFSPMKYQKGSAAGFDTLYFADDGNDTNTPSGVYKWSFNGSTWVNVGSITYSKPTGVLATFDVDGGGSTNVHLFVTNGGTASGGGRLSRFTDGSGYGGDPGDPGEDAAVPANGTSLGTVFRGVALAPVGTEPLGSAAQLSVGPIFGLKLSGLIGFTPATTKAYSLANVGASSLTTWSASADVNWLTLTPSSGGPLASGGSITLTVSFNANATSLTPGTNVSTITFTNSTAGNNGFDVATRPVTLILSQIGVTPTTNYFASGPVHGPYTPGTKIYIVTNASASSLTWGAGIVSNSNWLTVIPMGSTIAAGGSTAVSVSVTNANALALGRGAFVDTVVFTNSATSDPGNAARDVTLLTGGGFTSNNLVIYRTGDGSVALANTPQPVFVDEYTRDGTLIQSVPIATNSYSCSGTATAEGLMTRSTDRQYLVFVGYGTNKTYTASAPASVSTVVPRVVGRVDGNANVDVSTRLTDFNSGGNPRAAVSTNGIDMWVSGNNAGIRHTQLGLTNSTEVCTNPVSNVRALNIFSNQLYVGYQAGSLPAGTGAVATVGSGLPTAPDQVATTLPGFNYHGSTYNFVLFKLKNGATESFDTMYVADDAANNGGTLTAGGSIYKWSYDNSGSGQWVSNGTVYVNAVRGLAGDVTVVSGVTNVNLFAVGSGNGSAGGSTLYSYTDTNGWNTVPVGNGGTLGTGGLGAALVSTPANESWRSIALAPEIPATANLVGSPQDGLTVIGAPSEVTNSSNTKVYLISDVSNSSMTWTATWTSTWLSLSNYGGSLAAGDDSNVTVSINANATGLANGTYLDTISFVNTVNGQGNTTRSVSLTITAAVANAWSTWQNTYFPSGGPNAGGDADPDHDGVSNTNEFLSGFNPNNAAAYAHIISIVKSGAGMNVTYLGANGDTTYTGGPVARTNVLEFTTGTANGSYSNNFATTGVSTVLSNGTGVGVITNMVDPSGATGATRYYRIRVVAP